MDPFKKSIKDLCSRLLETEEFNTYLRAEINMKNDDEAMDLVKQYNELQLKIQAMVQQGQQPDQAVIAKVQELEKEMTGDSTIANYMRTQEDFKELMDIMNQMINDALKSATEKALAAEVKA